MTAEHISKFSDHLLAFLSRRTECGKTFFLGTWLQTLDDGLLAKLCLEASRFRKNALDSADLATLCAIAVATEGGASNVRIGIGTLDQWANSLHIAVNLEVARRKDLIVLKAPLSINPKNALEIRMTPKGIYSSQRYSSGKV